MNSEASFKKKFLEIKEVYLKTLLENSFSELSSFGRFIFSLFKFSNVKKLNNLETLLRHKDNLITVKFNSCIT